MRAVAFLTWEPEPDVNGHAAALAAPGRTLDLAITPRDDGNEVEWEVVEGANRIAIGYAPTVEAARRAAEAAARRALFRTVP